MVAKAPKEPLTWSMLLVATFSGLSGILFGYDLCIITSASKIPTLTSHSQDKAYTIADILDDIANDFETTTSGKELIVSIVMAGAALGSLFGGPLADVWGRRRSILLSAVVFVAGAAAMAAAPVFGVLLLGRFAVGAAVGASGMVVSVYLSELASPYWRGMIVATNELAVCAGCLLALGLSVVASDLGLHWRTLLAVSSLPAIAQLLGSPWLPQSPVWAVRRILSSLPPAAVAALLGGAGGNDTPPPHPEAPPLEVQLDWSHLGITQRQHLIDSQAALSRLRGSKAAADAELVRIVQVFLQQQLPQPKHSLSASGSSSDGSQGPSSSTRSLLASHSTVQTREPLATATAAATQTGTAAAATGIETHEASIVSSDDGPSVRSSQPSACAESLGQLQRACKAPGPRHALALAISAAVVQNMAFSNALLYYAKAIFDAAGLHDQLLPSLGIGTAKLLGVAAAIPLLPRLPRRMLLTAGMLGQIAACLSMAVAFAVCEQGSAALQGVVVVGMLVFIFAWDISWAPGLWVVCSELLPGQIRGTGMGLAVAAFWASSATSNQVVLTIADAWGWAGFMGVVAALTLFALGFVRIALPETQGRSLGAIQTAIAGTARGRSRAYLLCPLLLWPGGCCGSKGGRGGVYTPVH